MLETSHASTPSPLWKKLVVTAIVAILFAVLYWRFGRYLTLDALAAREAAFLKYGRNHTALVVFLTCGVYVVVTGLSLPGAAALSITIGWFYKQLFGPAAGYLAALVLVSFASTTGASLAFMLSRYLLRDAVQRRFAGSLSRFNRALEEEGAFYLFTLRLIPAVPYFVINAAMGLTPLPLRTFWWVSQLGMLPGTCVFIYAGWAVPSLQTIARQLEQEGIFSVILTPPVLIAFLLLALFPLAVRKLLARYRLVHSSSPHSPDSP